MYGVVLMMALSGAGEAPQCWHHHYYSCSCSCTGCFGYSCHGSYAYSCSGCSCYGCHAWRHHGWHGCHGCHGCYGSYSCSCSCVGAYGYYNPVVETPAPAPAYAPTPAAPMPPPPPPAKLPPPGTTSYFRTPATIQVSVPAQTVLYFDGVKMTSASTSRRFTTPPLETGKTYFYTVRAEVEQNGQTVATTQRVVVRAGQQAQVQIDLSSTGNLVARQD